MSVLLRAALRRLRRWITTRQRAKLVSRSGQSRLGPSRQAAPYSNTETPRHAAAPVDVIYIAGHGRSGSTLLNVLLGHVKGVFAGSELWITWQQGLENVDCACGVDFSECELWQGVFQEISNGWEDGKARKIDSLRWPPYWIVAWLVRTHLLSRKLYRRQQNWASELAQLYRGIQRTSGDAAIVDASKLTSNAVGLLSRKDVSLHVVHLVRDSRGTVYSLTKRGPWAGRTGSARAALSWTRANLGPLSLRPFAASYTLLRYEDLVEDPNGSITRILDKVPGLRAEVEIPGGEFAVERHHAISGNRGVRSETTLEVRLDERWYRESPLKQKIVVTSLTWPLLLFFRYPLSPMRLSDQEKDPP